MLETIRDFSAWTVDQFCDQNNNERRHVISFAETTEQMGFPVEEQLRDQEGWQFQLCREQCWRVHGILIGDTFYVVWLDARHSLYPR